LRLELDLVELVLEFSALLIKQVFGPLIGIHVRQALGALLGGLWRRTVLTLTESFKFPFSRGGFRLGLFGFSRDDRKAAFFARGLRAYLTRSVFLPFILSVIVVFDEIGLLFAFVPVAGIILPFIIFDAIGAFFLVFKVASIVIFG
jgi:hypothetical protein